MILAVLVERSWLRRSVRQVFWTISAWEPRVSAEEIVFPSARW